MESGKDIGIVMRAQGPQWGQRGSGTEFLRQGRGGEEGPIEASDVRDPCKPPFTNQIPRKAPKCVKYRTCPCVVGEYTIGVVSK